MLLLDGSVGLIGLKLFLGWAKKKKEEDFLIKKIGFSSHELGSEALFCPSNNNNLDKT